MDVETVMADIVIMLGIPRFFRDLMTVTRFGKLPTDVILIIISFAMEWDFIDNVEFPHKYSTMCSTLLGELYGARVTQMTERSDEILLMRDGDTVAMLSSVNDEPTRFVSGTYMEIRRLGCTAYYNPWSPLSYHVTNYDMGHWTLTSHQGNITRHVTRYDNRVIGIEHIDAASNEYVSSYYMRGELIAHHSHNHHYMWCWYFRHGKVYFSGYSDDECCIVTTHNDDGIATQKITYARLPSGRRDMHMNVYKLTHLGGVRQISLASIMDKLRDGTSFCVTMSDKNAVDTMWVSAKYNALKTKYNKLSTDTGPRQTR